MLDKNASVALVLPTQQEVELFSIALAELGFRKVTVFRSGKEAFEVCSRQQFAIFITRMELPDMTGIVLIQKLRETGNYGLETHLFVCDKLVPSVVNLLYELDLPYVLVKPFTKPTIKQKFEYLLETEKNIPDYEEIFRGARSAYFNKLNDMALEMAQKALKIKPDLDKALILMGDILSLKNNIVQAQEYYRKAMTANPKSVAAAYKLAFTMASKGDNVQAAALFNKLASINPYHIKILENAGLTNFKAEQYEEAQKHVNQLYAVDKNNQVATQIVADIKIKDGDFSDLVSTLKRSMDEKEIVQYLNNAGVKLSHGNDVEGALRMYQSAIEQLGANSKHLYAIYYNIGIAYKRMGKWDKAKSAFERSLRLKPDFDKAAQALAEIGKVA